jgi:hypothetical protein
MTSGLPTPTPGVNPETREFWEAAGRGVFLLKRCGDCGSVIWYPRQLCPECSSMNTEWFEATGRGTIYSYTINRRGDGEYRDASPYVLAYVELDEGPRVLTNIVADDLADIAVGDPVEVFFDAAGDGVALYRFRPSRS